MKTRSVYICQQCSHETQKWYGRCPSCDEWNSLVETVKETVKSSFRGAVAKQYDTKPKKLSSVRHIEKNRLNSGIREFDTVVGSGIVPGSVVLLAGDPGVGKSTLILHVLSRIGGLYVSGEESAEQIKLRSKRLGIEGDNITVLAETEIEYIKSTIRNYEVETGSHLPLVIVDSIQTLSSADLTGMAGSVGQIRHCAEQLIEIAKLQSVPIVIIGHVTKSGTIAGPKILEHMVDAVLYLEGERFQNARILRTLKNRFGAIEEVGIFEMKDDGLKEITNPSKLFLQDRVKNVPGSTVTVVMEGTRPVLVEIQALVVPSQLAIPRRVASGVDFNRIQLLTAILQKRLNIPIGTHDVFVNVSGGLKISEPSADLAICTAILSSFHNKAVDPKSIVYGEVGLLGEVRSVGGSGMRKKEAKRLGFTRVWSAESIKNLKKLASILQ